MDLSRIDNDFSDEEVERINTYVKNGCIGLERLASNEAQINSMFSLYMAGKTYTEISKITRQKKDLVLYMSAKMRWYENKMAYLKEIQDKMTERLTDTRVQSLNFISSLINAHHKYYGDKIDEFLSTGNKNIMEELDLKSLSQYFKSIEILEKIMNPSNVNSKGGSKATININTAGGTVEQLDENTIEITPSNTGNILKALAEIKDKQKKDK